MNFSPEAAFLDVRYKSADGLTLAARDYGSDNSGLPVICLPGLSRTVRDFHRLAVHLSRERPRPRRVVTFDYRGRGASQHDADWRNYNARTEAIDVLDGMATLGLQHAAFVGTSRGGIVTMLVAMLRPEAIVSAVLNDVGPIIESAGLARIKAILGIRSDPKDWDEATTLLHQAYGRDFPDFDASDWRLYAEAVYASDGGAPRSDFDPALLHTLEAVTADQPLPPLWGPFAALAGRPLLVLRGEHSDLLTDATLEQMSAMHAGMATLIVSGQGHPPMLTRPDLLNAIGDFIDRSDPAA